MQDRVMLITGTSKGIGRYLSGYYLSKGYTVVGCSRGTIDDLGLGYYHYSLDVTDELEVSKVIKDINRRFGRLDVLINNAGIASMNHTVLTPGLKAKAIMDTNFMGVFNLCKEASKLMLRNKFGRIVNFSTVAVAMSIEGEAVYAASKSGVETFSKVLAKELAGYNITCNVVAPSPVATDLIASVPKAKIDKLIEGLTIKRLTELRDISNVIDFYISEASDYITGQVIYLGGA